MVKHKNNNHEESNTHPAGDFIRWVEEVSPSTTKSEKPTGTTPTTFPNTPNVPCGSCNACCKSSYFIHINKDERDTLMHIPQALLFAAPGQTKGNMLMGFDETGKCPMLVDDKCSIYLHRPQTCREYDCRIFAAAGINAGGNEKSSVNAQVKKWAFEHQRQDTDAHADSQASTLQAATQRAAEFLQTNSDEFEQNIDNPTQIALLAISLHRLFLTQPVLSKETLISRIRKILAR